MGASPDIGSGGIGAIKLLRYCWSKKEGQSEMAYHEESQEVHELEDQILESNSKCDGLLPIIISESALE